MIVAAEPILLLALHLARPTATIHRNYSILNCRFGHPQVIVHITITLLMFYKYKDAYNEHIQRLNAVSIIVG